MKITHLEHSCVLIEVAGERILIDPGNFSTRWHSLQDLTAILVTHQHPDHIDPNHIHTLVTANPGAKAWVEPATADLCPAAEMIPVEAGERLKLGEVEIEAVGGNHAIIHSDIPRIGNLGWVIRAPGEPSFFHPGDALDTTPSDIDCLAIPAHGPWCAMKETIDFARAVNAPHGFLIHDGLINDRGWNLTFTRLQEMTQTELVDLRDGSPWEVAN